MIVRPRQLEVLEYINEYWLAHEQGPTGREISAKFGWAQGSEQFHLKILRETGMLVRVPGRERDLRVTEEGTDALDNMLLARSIGVEIGIEFADSGLIRYRSEGTDD